MNSRAKIVNWIISINFHMDNDIEAFFLSINIFDRYTKEKYVSESLVELVAIGSIFISSKYVHDENFLYLEEIDLITRYRYKREDILQMERDICKTLDYTFSVRTSYHYFLKFWERTKKCFPENKNIVYGVYLLLLSEVKFSGNYYLRAEACDKLIRERYGITDGYYAIEIYKLYKQEQKKFYNNTNTTTITKIYYQQYGLISVLII